LEAEERERVAKIRADQIKKEAEEEKRQGKIAADRRADQM
jgi:hypothetical protein